MAFAIKTDNTRVYTGVAPEVTPTTDFETKEQQKDKVTGLPMWSLKAELDLGDGSGIKAANLKFASATAPTVEPRKDYEVNGDLLVTPYLPNGSTRIEYSYKVVGTLRPARPARSE